MPVSKTVYEGSSPSGPANFNKTGVFIMQKNNDKYNGVNILSYGVGVPFQGRIIKEWIVWHMTHDCGQKTKMANSMKKYLSIDDDVLYCLLKNDYHSAENFGEYYVQKYTSSLVCRATCS